MRHWIPIFLSFALAGCTTLKVRIDHRAEDVQVRKDRSEKRRLDQGPAWHSQGRNVPACDSTGDIPRQHCHASLHQYTEDIRSAFVAPANSIRFLRAKSPLLEAILKLPMSRSVPYHSIIGDRGKGNSPESTDGVVPYWSSHLEGADSEKIVPSGHGANETPKESLRSGAS